MTEYGLVRPFVTVASAGGPYDDGAFCAGYQAALIEKALYDAAKVATTMRFEVYSSLVPDLDLIAMQYGFKMTSKPWQENPDEWTVVTFDNEPSDTEQDTGPELVR